MIGYLLLQEEPTSLDELAENLRVSKASVSTNARALELHGIVERHSVPGDRRDYYMIVDEPWSRSLDNVRRQLESRIDLFEEARSELPDEFDVGKRRLATWQLFFSRVVEKLDAHLEGWCDFEFEGESTGGGQGISEER